MDIPVLADIGPDVSDVTETLRTVAETYPPESREHQTLAYAASALLFLHAADQLKALDGYVTQANQPLSETEQAFLRTLGITDEDGR